MRSLQILYLIAIIQSWEVNTIIVKQTIVRNVRRHIGPSPLTDWELGLREAVHQAFLREHYNDPNLQQHLQQAPIIGYQNIATPFGDIAIIARGQLYLTSDGYQFLQDPYQNDCDECHNNNKHYRCLQPPCQTLWKSKLIDKQLLALWTVKRIRHRDPNFGHIFELEYTISPINQINHVKLLTRNGNFNYNLPGHVFVIKSDPHLNSAHYLNNNNNNKNTEKHEQSTGKFYQNQHHHHHYHQGNNEQFSPIPQYSKPSTHLKTGILIGTSPEGFKHVLHSFPGFYSSYQPHTIYESNNDQTTIDPKEYELYKKLIESLSAKTSQLPHRFGVTPTKTTSSSSSTTTSTTTPTYQETVPYIPAPETTTFLQLPDGQIYQITENTIKTTTNNYQLPVTDQETTQVLIPTTVQTTEKTTTEPYYEVQELPKPINIPVTTIHYFAPVEEEPIPVTQTTTMEKEKTTTKKFTTTTPPATTDEDFNLFPDVVPTKPMVASTTRKKVGKGYIFPTYTPITKTIISIIPSKSGVQTTTANNNNNKEENNNLRPTNIPTKAIDIITQIPLVKKRPNSINEQLPPPENNLDTTIPYVSTATVPTPINIEEFTESSKTSQTQDEISTTQFFTRPPTTIQETTNERTTTATTEIEDEETSPLSITTIQLTTGEDYMNDTTLTTERLNETTMKEIGKIPEIIQTTILPSTIEHMSTILEKIETTKLPTTYYINLPTVTTTEMPETTEIPERTETEMRMIKMNLRTSSERDIEKTTPTTITIPITTRKTPPKYRRKYNRRTKKPKTTTTSDDFLIDTSNKSYNYDNIRENSKKLEITDDDIFGHDVQIMQTKPTKIPLKKITKSDLEEALFGGDRRVKQIKLTSKLKPRTTSVLTTTSTTPTKVIYSDFYQVSTTPTITLSSFTTQPIETTTEFHPFTDQSYSTSISFQVNKKSNKRNSRLQPTLIGKLINKNRNNYDEKNDEKLHDNPEFNNLALQLINHARTIDYLNKKPKIQTNNNKRN